MLERYEACARDELPAFFQIAKKIAVEKPADVEQAWALHGPAVQEFVRLSRGISSIEQLSKLRSPLFSLLDLKTFLAEKILEKCCFCERRCGVNRARGERGFCGVGAESRVFGAHSHYGEEPLLVPSATLFFSGCTMRCAYCQNAPDSVDAGSGEVWSPERIARWIEFKRGECKNVNFVGGEPTPNLHNILKALCLTNANIPVVWNSNSYYSPQAGKLLWGVADVYLLDFRYASNACAERLSAAPNYVDVARRNFLAAADQGEVLCRLLVLPNHVKCDALPILDWLARVLRKKVLVNVMAQYRPCWHAFEHKDVARALSREEFERARQHARKLGLTLAE